MTKNKSTMITGAASGIGIAIAKKFAQEGHDLYLLVRKKNSVGKLVKFFETDL